MANSYFTLMDVLNKMDITYKKLTEKELDIFIKMRINQLREEGATEDIDLVPNLKDHYKRHMELLSHGLQWMGIRL